MSSEEFTRYLAAIVGVIGVGILAVTLGGQFGWWAAGAVLLGAGAFIGVPLWSKHFEADRLAQAAANRPVQPRKATEESPSSKLI